MIRPYRAVLFDLFDTLVRLERDRLPLVHVNGRELRSSVGRLHEVLSPAAPHVTIEALHGAMGESWKEAERLRAIDHREVAAPERFAYLFRCLALDPDACRPGLINDLIETHRRELARAVAFPDRHRALLKDLGAHYRMAVVSNFDYTPTALGILREAGIADLFETIVVSDAVGWRKPAPTIFRQTLATMGLEAADALFVGDRIDIDVAGARALRMDAAWLNPDAEARAPEHPAPTYELRDLVDLRGILGVPAGDGSVGRGSASH